MVQPKLKTKFKYPSITRGFFIVSENYILYNVFMKKIFVVGSINVDLSISADDLPKKGETISGKDFHVSYGGKGANQAVASKKLGGDVYMCGCVGDDAYGKEVVDSLNKLGINTEYIYKVDNEPTGTAIIILTNGDNRIIVDRGANAFLSKEQIDKFLEKAEPGDIYLTQLECPSAVVGYGLERAKEKGMFVVLNPAPAKKEIVPYIKNCDLVTPNETELEFFGEDTFFKYKELKVIVTLGGNVYKIVQDNKEKQYPCIKVNAIDTVAAGDTLVGGLVAKLSKGSSLEDAASFGSKAASIACTRRGAQTSIPSEEEVNSYKG